LSAPRPPTPAPDAEPKSAAFHDWRFFWCVFACIAPLWLGLSVWWVQSSWDSISVTTTGPDLKERSVTIEGQEVVLRGAVTSPEERESLRAHYAQSIRSGPAWWNGSLNPIASVRDELTVLPPPHGYFILTRLGNRATIAGQAATQEELEQVLQAATPLLGPQPDTLLFHAAAERAPARTLNETLSSLEALGREANPQEPLLLATTLGWPAQRFLLSESDAELERQFTIAKWPWEIAQPILAELRQWTAEAAEQQRIMALPPPHLLMLLSSTAIHLRGTLVNEDQKSQLLAALKSAYGNIPLTESITLANTRRPVPDLLPSLQDLPRLPTDDSLETLACLELGMPWEDQTIPDEGIPETALTDWRLVRSSLPVALVTADFQALRDISLQRQAERRALAASQLPAPYLALLQIGNQLLLRGEIADAATQAKLTETLQARFPAYEIINSIRLEPARRPLLPQEWSSWLESFPTETNATGPGLLSFAAAGKAWKSIDVPPLDLPPSEYLEMANAKLLTDALRTDGVYSDLMMLLTKIEDYHRSQASMKLSQAPPQPYIAMLALHQRIILRGDAGSEKFKAKLLEAARKFYADREVIDEMRVESELHEKTITTFSIKTFPPAPHLDGPGLLGFNLPGQPWLQVPLTWEMPSRDSLETAGLFSKMFEPSQAWPDFEAWLPLLAERKKPAPPDTP
jgi:hypothetical protein